VPTPPVAPVLDVIVPAYNEADRVAGTVSSLRACPSVARVIVVDDASRDGTSEAARAAGAEVIAVAGRRRKGGAMAAGLGVASARFVAFIDADLAGTAALVGELAAPVLAGDADLSIAKFEFAGGLRGFGWVLRLSRWAVRRYCGLRLDNPLCGQRAMPRDVAARLLPFGPGFAVETRMTIVAGRLGLRLVEVPLAMDHRRSGRDLQGILHRAAQFKDVLLETLRWALGLAARGREV